VTITVELPDNLEAALKAQADARGLSEAGYVRTVLERDLAALPPTPPAPHKVEDRADMPNHSKRKRLSELFAPLSGLDIDLRRNPSAGRPVDL